MHTTEKRRLRAVAEIVEQERQELMEILRPCVAYSPEANQLEAALKALDTATGLMRAVGGKSR